MLNEQVNMKLEVVFAILFIASCSYMTEASIKCALFKEYGNVTKPILGAEEAIALDVPANIAITRTIEFPTVSSNIFHRF